jgi:hypothetical protein
MGYTHYWYRTKTIEQGTFKEIVHDFLAIKPVMEHLGVRLAGWDGRGEPEITYDVIRFNGVEKCGHPSMELDVAWPTDKAKGIAQNREMAWSAPTGEWFAGALVSTRVCGGDCSNETFDFPREIGDEGKYRLIEKEIWGRDKNGKVLRRPANEVGKYFYCCKTAYKPYDFAVNAILIIAKHYLGNDIIIHSDGAIEQWQDVIGCVNHFLGYGADFKLDEDE